MIKIEKYKENPILKAEFDWESKGVFNPGAVKIEGKIYLIYRAISSHNSCLGFTVSNDGFHFRKRENPFLNEIDPVEDPRITKMEEENRIIVTFTDLTIEGPEIGFLGLSPDLKRVRSLVTLDKHIEDKDAVLFPRRIKGEYLLLHRPHRWHQRWFLENYKMISKFNLEFPKFEELPQCPSIWISFSNDKNFSTWKNHQLLMKPIFPWEERKIGAGVPPIETSEGWILFYHGVDKDFVYRGGVALLEKNNPWKVKARLPYPILEPEEDYEGKIVFPTGAIIEEDQFLIYYGANDKYICVGSVEVNKLMKELKKYPVQ